MTGSRIRGIRSPIPQGFVLGRSAQGSGDATFHKAVGGIKITNDKIKTAFTGDVSVNEQGAATVKSIGGGQILPGSYAVADLPTPDASLTLARTFINDSAAAPVFSAAVTGGGSLTIPVYCDGTDWRNG